LSGRGRFSKGSADAAGKVDRILSRASLLSMKTSSDPDLPDKRGVNHDEWFVREVDKGIAAADGGKLVEHSDVRDLIHERYPG